MDEVWFGHRWAAGPESLILRSFAVDQDALAVDTPGIARGRTIVANDTMAGNGDSELVRGASACHGTDGPRRANAPRNFSIGHSRAGRDFLERLPHAFLEGSAANIKRKIQPDPWLFDESDDSRHQGLVVAISADKMRLWESVLKIAHELFRIIPKKDGGDAFLGRRDQYGAQRRLADREL